ncbi:hypothetical protein LUZ61_003799 [Rhynchospora tenuis]|uniref:LNK1 n=1 Tax=Rhynchospora tenuis TaxID=198213 RepID=A0AAD5ZLZ0_9POAL|nr:hypothetical protein LUZ61_003799 [Rhynchospora tenuis]
MPDWKDNQIKDNIRGEFVQSSDLGLDASNKKTKHVLDTTPDDISGDQKTTNSNGFGVTNSNGFGVTTNKPFENGSASVTQDQLENGGNGVSYGENDLAYYDWPTIDNFEDVDKLFRNCDSTFGERQTMEGGGADLSWFPSSSDAIYTSEMEALNEFSTYTSGKPDLHTSANAEVEDAFASSQMDCEGEEREELAANQIYSESSLNGYGALDMTGNPHLSVESITQDLVDQNCSLVSPSKLSNSPFVQNPGHQVESGSSSYLTFNSYPGIEQTPSTVEPPAERRPTAMRKKVEKLKNGQLINSIQQPLTETPSFVANRKNEFERGIDESKSILDSSVLMNGSSNKNGSALSANDLSVEETSFKQLQDVMNQLDLKTKLCIRDSLYRLARSVQQRNGFSDASSSYDNGDAQYSAINNGFVEPINPETGTNPIDRSIAELLFHQPPSPVPNSGTNIRTIEEANSVKNRVSNEHNNHAPAVVAPCIERQIHISSDRKSTK